MADIVTEQQIQIQRLEQALHITQWCNWLLLCLPQNQGPSWLAEFKGIWFQSSDHLVDATLPATEVK
ncbi:unnamed protein product [Prunus armeniaca]